MPMINSTTTISVPQKALTHVGSRLLDACESAQEMIDKTSKLVDASIQEDLNPFSRHPKSLAELCDNMTRSAIRGAGYAAAPGIATGAAWAIVIGTAAAMWTAPVRAMLATVTTPKALLAALLNPPRAAKAWFIDAPVESFYEGPRATAITGVPCLLAMGGGASSALFMGPSIGAALVCAELGAGTASLLGLNPACGRALDDAPDRASLHGEGHS